jgi:hypothetical protein
MIQVSGSHKFFNFSYTKVTSIHLSTTLHTIFNMFITVLKFLSVMCLNGLLGSALLELS